MASVISFNTIEDAIDTIKKHNPILYTNLNMNPAFNISRKNGYKIFWVSISREDKYFKPEDMHGLRIYTVLSNHFTDNKSAIFPVFQFNNEDTREFVTEYGISSPFNVYIGAGYLNALVYGQENDWFFNESYKHTDNESFGFLVVQDCMYYSRSNAILKLLSLFKEDD